MQIWRHWLAQYFQNYPHLKLHKMLVMSVVKYVVREIVWVVRPYSLVAGREHFRVTHSLTVFLSVEAPRSSESLVITYQTIKHNYLRRHIPIRNFFISYFHPTQNTCTYVQLDKKRNTEILILLLLRFEKIIIRRKTQNKPWHLDTWLKLSFVWSYLITSSVCEDYVSSIESNWQQSYYDDAGKRMSKSKQAWIYLMRE